jgi:hypothetical protein
MDPIAFLPVVGVALYLLLRLLFGRRGKKAKAEVFGSEDELIRLCHGDEDKADRLIALERTRAPNLSRSEAARRACDSIRRDMK